MSKVFVARLHLIDLNTAHVTEPGVVASFLLTCDMGVAGFTTCSEKIRYPRLTSHV